MLPALPIRRAGNDEPIDGSPWETGCYGARGGCGPLQLRATAHAGASTHGDAHSAKCHARSADCYACAHPHAVAERDILTDLHTYTYQHICSANGYPGTHEHADGDGERDAHAVADAHTSGGVD